MSPTDLAVAQTRTWPPSVTSPITAPPVCHFSQTASTSSTLRRLDHRQHPLLRLGDHDLEGLHVGLAQRHPGDVDVDPDPAGGGHLGGRGGEPGGAEVLQRDEQALLQQLEAALEHLRLLERVADLHGRALRSSPSPSSAEASTEAPPIPSRPVEAPIRTTTLPTPGGGGADHVLGPGEADAHRVDQAVLLVGGLEVDLAADRRHADRVAVVADPAHDAVEQVARARRVELAEAQRVEDRDRPGAEREDVAQDAADPGRRALERLDRARVVVRLDLEGDRPAVADVDRAGVLARPHHHPLALGRQPPQQLARVLVGAVLGPEQREHRQLDVVRLAPEQLDDQLVLGVGEAELAVLGGDRHRAPASRSRAPGQALEDPQAVGRPGQRVDRVLGVGHQADHVAGLVA